MKKKSSGLELFIFAVLSLVLGVFVVHCSRSPWDDSYIPLRIARNFAEHGKPYYNMDDPVLGASCHVWILLVAAIFKVFGANSLTPIVGCEVLLTLGLFYVLTVLLRPHLKNFASVLAFVILFAVALPFAAVLRETTLVFLFFALTLLYLERNNCLLAGVFAALAAFTRNEFVIFSALLLVVHRKNWRLWLGHLIVATPLLFFLWVFYGHIVPQPMIAKNLVYKLSFATKAAELVFPGYQIRCENGGECSVSWPQSLVVCGFLFSVLYLVGQSICRVSKDRMERVRVSVLVFSFLLILVYLSTTTWISFWYWPNALFPLAIWLATNIRKSYVCVSGLLLGFSFRVINTAYFIWLCTFAAPGIASDRTSVYRELGEQLYKNHRDDVIYATEIGGLGWSFPGKIIDAFGLASSDTFRYLKQTHGDAPNRGNFTQAVNLRTLPLVLQNSPPQLIVSMPILLSIQEDEASRQILETRYRLIDKRQFYPPFYDSNFIAVYRLN